MSFTVVPLHNLINLNMPTGSSVPFGGGFVLDKLPEWLATHPIYEKHIALNTHYALIAEYETTSPRDIDPHVSQNDKIQAALLANLALWMVQPSRVCLTAMFYRVSWLPPDQHEALQNIQELDQQFPLLCHPNDNANMVSLEQAIEAGRLHQILVNIPRKNSVWTAMRAFWAALIQYARDIRYLIFWIGLEALFGSDDGREIAYKLAQRIAFFTSDCPDAARLAFHTMKELYSMRSKIAHGRWKDDPKFDSVMAETEATVRKIFLHLLNDQNLIDTFASNKRDRYLEDFVFSHAG